MEILELLDELEAKILQGKKPLFNSNPNIILVDKQEVIDVIDVVKKMINEKYQALKANLEDNQIVDLNNQKPQLYKNKRLADQYEDVEAKQIIEDARSEAMEIKKEIDDFSQKVLQNLKLAVTKCKGRLVKLDTIIDMTQERMDKTAFYSEKMEDNDID
ncbi:MAG: hypothetical protein PHF25_03750 [Candidatus Margulisbacteria bacterium]|nr:hypothetical protein [Candidatus Margulisiibacteriota bacterium]